MQKTWTITAALLGFLFLITVSVTAVLNMRWIYYRDISALNLVEETGFSEETIRRNYDILIDYNLIAWGDRELEFPDFHMSEQGRIHFEEVKEIFVLIQYLCIVSGLLLLICLVRQIRRKQYEFLKLTSILTLVIPLILGAAATLWWEQAFVLFHKLFFRNDYWLFDPAADPVIYILPDGFFFHCAIAIVFMILLGSLICRTAYYILRHRNEKCRR